MKIPIEFYELLRNRINLSDIVRQKVLLTRKSNEYLGLCPFHNEKTPSFTVNDIKKFYYCFGCAESGDVIKFVSKISGLSYKDSAIKLARDYAIELPKLTKEQKIIYEESELILNILQLAANFFHSQLQNDALNYLQMRGINKTIIKEFNIGFTSAKGKLQQFFKEKEISELMLIKAGLLGKREDGKIYEIFHNRIIFPIHNVYNKIIGFGGRVIGDALPKYLNSPETIVFKKNETLYGENTALTASYNKKYSILVEGYLDVISLHKAGFTESVASLGTAITESHLQKLWRVTDEIVICLDGDTAGIKASIRAINLALPLVTNKKKISFVRLPKNSDPDDIITHKGKEYFARLVEERIELSTMIWHIEYEDKNFTSPEARAKLEADLSNYCNYISDNVLRNCYHRFFKDQIWQNVTRRQNKANNYTNERLPQYHLSELETLEYAFCSILVRFPAIFNNEAVTEFLLTLPLTDINLSDFRDWYFEVVISNQYNNVENIKEIVEKTRFNETFLLLLESDNIFQQLLSISFNNKEIDHNLLWELLHKQYNLILLKQENASNGWSEKTKLYQQEILKTAEELENLKKSFYNN